VTARLSRKFYERFGDDLTNELVEWFNQVDATYRSELREINELNWTRFEAKLEECTAEVRADLHAGLADCWDPDRSPEALTHRRHTFDFHARA